MAHGVRREAGGRSLNSVPAGQDFARKRLEGAFRASTGNIQTFFDQRRRKTSRATRAFCAPRIGGMNRRPKQLPDNPELNDG